MQIPKTPAPPPPEPPPPSKPVPMTERVALFLRTRTKPTLPAGYQFGDAGHWNTIEADLDTPEHIDSDAVESP